MPSIKIATIQDNPYRDRNLFPTDPAKIESLKESIEQTGFWDNIMVRPKFNELVDGTIIEDHEQLAAIIANNEIDWENQEFELAYGHHRIDTLIELGYESIDIPVKYITDEDMMRIMANENKEGWGSGIKNKLETVRQVKARLEDMFNDYAGYADYVATVGQENVVFSKKQFQDAKTQGIGYRTVQSFLGASWNPTDVRIPMAVFKAVEKGYFKQEDVFDFETLGILDSFTACVVALYEGGKIKQKVEEPKTDDAGKVMRDDSGEPIMVKVDKFVTAPAPTWPAYYKQQMVEKLIQQCLPTEMKDERGDEDLEMVKEAVLTQSQLNKRRVSMLKNQSAPTTGAAKAFDLKTAIVREFFPGFDPACPDDERENLHKQLVGKDMDNFKKAMGEWIAIDGIVKELEEKFAVLLAPLEDAQPDDLQQEMDEEAGTSADYDSDFKDMELDLDEDQEGEAVAKPIGKISSDVVALLTVACTGIDGLIDRAEEVDIDTDEVLSDSIRISITKLAKLYHDAASPEDLKMLFAEIAEEL